jgi:glycosidase
MKHTLKMLIILMAIGCMPGNKDKTVQKPNENKKEKVVIYQMMTRLFGNKKSNNIKYGTREENGVGKFNDITTKALREIKALGITHVWYTGVIEHAIVSDYSDFGIAIDDADVVKGRAGSPYAIKDYYDVNPDLAASVPDRLNEFRQLIGRTHEAGMKVIIDFVPNHVARTYVSDASPGGTSDFGEKDDTSVTFAVDNNFYYIPGEKFTVPSDYEPIPGDAFTTKDGNFDENPAKATGNDKFSSSPSKNDWFETVKLNYGVDMQNGRAKYFDPIPDTWMKMRDILSYWAQLDVDGFRCDMAEMVPVEFWGWVIPQIEAKHPDIVFIAEIYNPQEYENYIQKGKFSFLYDKVELYDTLRNIIVGTGSTNNIASIIQDFERKQIDRNILRFMENHDEQRLASHFFAGDWWAGWPAVALSSTISNGPMMIYFGQEVGEPGLGEEGFQGDDGRTTIFDYWGVPEHQKWMNEGVFDGGKLSDDQKKLRSGYARLLNLCNTNAAIREGKYYDLHGFNRQSEQGYQSDKVYTFIKQHNEELILIICNFDGEEKQLSIALPQTFQIAKWDDSTDLLTNQTMKFASTSSGLESVALAPYQVMILKPNL